MHGMSNSNKFKDFYQAFEKNPKLFFVRKKSSRIHKEYLNNFFWPKISTINTLCANVYKMYECEKNQMHYCNVKFWAIDKYGPHWINFIIYTFISENNRYFKSLYKFGTKFFHLT